jgi:pre-mRNA-splicing factor SPF27
MMDEKCLVDGLVRNMLYLRDERRDLRFYSLTLPPTLAARGDRPAIASPPLEKVNRGGRSRRSSTSPVKNIYNPHIHAATQQHLILTHNLPQQHTMALTTAVHDSLPYIDPDPTSSERAAAQALIDAELETNTDADTTISHPSLPPLPPSNLSHLIEQELQRVSSSPREPLSAIDLSRYEASPLPSSSDADILTALRRAQTAHTYLRLREGNMELLDRFGRNAWLVGNSQTEEVLAAVEREVEERKREIDGVVVERRSAQEGVRGEVEGLAEGWRRGVGRVLETEVAAESVRRGVLERRRAGGV